MTLTLFRKGRAAEAGAHANRALFDSLKTQEQRDRFTRWQQLRSAHEQKLFAGPGTQDPTQYREQLAEVRRQIDVLEEQLADASPLVRTLTPRKWDDMLPAISSKLPSRSALVEIVLTNRIQLRAAGATSRWDGPHYLAMVLFPNQRIAVADLGEAASVDRTATELLVGLQSSSSDPLPAAQALYKAIVSPLEANISDLSRLYLSLDGRLNLIPFAALHDGRQYLVERYQLDYLTSGRDLLREPVGSGQQPAVFADPDFTGLPPGRGLATTRAVDRSMRGLYAELGKLPRLPGTRREAQMLARLLPTAVVRTGQAATEQTLRQVRAPLLLHIATHGVFLQDEPPQALRESLSGRAFTPLTSAQSPMPDPASISFRALGQREASPLSRSALLFAGAAQAAQSPTADQDGLLTAEEARSLNLWGTQLVVLSACETGQGLVSTGQGVYGLRRAFFIAGAETLVTSLWMVADEETGDLMNSFYQKLILERKPTVRAMQEAMLDLRRKKPHPYFWAPFIVLGRDAPLRNQSASGPIAPVY